MAMNPDAPLRMLRERTRQFVVSGMVDCMARANDELFELANTARDRDEQSQYLDAMRLWHGARRGIADALANCVEGAFTALVRRMRERPVEAASAARGLAADDELEEMIAIHAIVTAATEPMREVLARLLGRVEALCGSTLTPEEFPLTPHFVMANLAREIGNLGLAARARLAILRACQETLLRTLPGVVTQADDLLRQLGVRVCRDGPDPGFAADGVEILPHRGDAVKAGQDLSRSWASRRAVPGGVVSTVESAGGASPDVATLPADVAAPGADFRALLEGLRRQGSASGGRRAGIGTRLACALTQMGRGMAELEPGDAQRVRLVDALFDAVANGNWIPAALGELLAAAEIPVLVLASDDPAFLTKPLHPARRLLQEIIVAATDFLHDDNYREQELFRCAGAAIDSLAARRGAPDRFAVLLLEFATLVEREREGIGRRAAAVLREAAVRERTDAAHARVARILNSRVSGQRYPLALIDMIERGWCLVLFDAWVKFGEESPQWRGAVHLLDQLVGVAGDAKPDQGLVAQLLEALAARLDTIAFDRFEASCLLDNLRLCWCEGASPSAAPPSLVLTPAEARQLDDPRLLVTVDDLRLALPGVATHGAQEFSASLDQIDPGRVDALPPGSWVEFRELAGDRYVAQLLGVVQPADTFVFGDHDGAVRARLPRPRLALALKEGQAIVRDNAQLFERALRQALAHMAATPMANGVSG